MSTPLDNASRSALHTIAVRGAHGGWNWDAPNVTNGGMKTSRLLMAAALGSAAVLACSSDPETVPGPTGNTASTTATVAGPVTSSTTNTVVTNAVVTTASVSAVTASASASSTTGGGTTTGAAVTTTGAGGATATVATTTATTGGAECQVTTPATAAVPITPEDGWVNCNDIGMQGAFYTYGDGTSTIMPADFTAAGDTICINGEVAATGTDIWGAGVGFNLNQDGGSDAMNPWNATAAGITGISFTLDVLPAGGLMRLIYASGGTDYCVEVTAAGAQTIKFADTTQDCWEAGGAAPDVTTLEAVKWQVAAVTDAYPFEFCLSAIQAIP